MKTDEKIRTFDVYSSIPEGWKIAKGVTTAPVGYVAITNGKSFFSGERITALIKLENIK